MTGEVDGFSDPMAISSNHELFFQSNTNNLQLSNEENPEERTKYLQPLRNRPSSAPLTQHSGPFSSHLPPLAASASSPFSEHWKIAKLQINIGMLTSKEELMQPKSSAYATTLRITSSLPSTEELSFKMVGPKFDTSPSSTGFISYLHSRASIEERQIQPPSHDSVRSTSYFF